jgi:hypothetical protein
METKLLLLIVLCINFSLFQIQFYLLDTHLVFFSSVLLASNFLEKLAVQINIRTASTLKKRKNLQCFHLFINCKYFV